MTNGEQTIEIVKRVAGKYAFVINAIMAIIPIGCFSMNAIDELWYLLKLSPTF